MSGERIRFGVTSRVDELDGLETTLEHLAEAFPDDDVAVALIAMGPEPASAIAARWPRTYTVDAPTTGAGRSRICDAAADGPVVFLRAGSTPADPDGLRMAIEATGPGQPLVFCAGVDVTGDTPAPMATHGWHRPTPDAPARITGHGEGRLTVTTTPGNDLERADLGGADCVVSAAVIGPQRGVDWDHQLDDADLCGADLALALRATPRGRATTHAAFRVSRKAESAAHLIPTHLGASLGRFLDRHDLFEMSVDDEHRDFLTTRRESRLGPRVRTLRAAAGAVTAHWRSPATLTERWANLASTATIGRHIASANPDELAANVFFARDGSWAFVRGAVRGHEEVLQWLRGHELGVARDDVGDMRAGRLLTAADIGWPAAGELLRRPQTTIFTVVDDPASRLECMWRSSFGDGGTHHPPGAALRSYVRRRMELDPSPGPQTLGGEPFLAAIASLPDERRDARWRRMTDALALTTLRYDHVLTSGSLADELPQFGARLGLEATSRPTVDRVLAELADDEGDGGAVAGPSDAWPLGDTDAVRAACGDDLMWAVS